MKKLLVTLALSTLALTACSGVDEAPTPTPSREASTVTEVKPSPTAKPKPKPKADPGQAWADKMITLFLNGNSKSRFSDFNDELPHHYITKWEKDSEGALKVTVSGGNWSAGKLSILGRTIMSTAGYVTPGLKEVIVVEEAGKDKGYATREDVGDWS